MDNNYSQNQYKLFRVLNFPAKFKLSEIKDLFLPYGSIQKIVPTSNSLSDVTRLGLNLLINPIDIERLLTNKIYYKGYKLELTLLNNDNTQKEECEDFIKFPFFNLSLGTLLKDKFLKEWEINIDDKKINTYTNYLRFNFDKAEINIYFDNEDNQYKLNIPFEDILDKIKLQSFTISSTLIVNLKRPPRLWCREGIKRPYYLNSYVKKNFEREIFIDLKDKESYSTSYPICFGSSNRLKIGSFLCWKIDFRFQLTYDMTIFYREIRKCAEYNKFSPQVKSNISLIKHEDLEERGDLTSLPFNIRYLIESIISLNLTSPHCITKKFLDVLKLRKNSKVILHIVECIWAEENFISNLEEYFLEQYKAQNIIKSNQTIPTYNALISKIVITPTKGYLLPPTLELTNRIIRKYKRYKDHFLRVVFTDEDMKRVGSNFNQNHKIFRRIYEVLNNGIYIAGRHYKFLAFSSSQLREHGCWFFYENDEIKINHIYSWMGDFSSIHVIAKYAARMGQSFSSSRDGAHIDEYSFKEIPDIIRNGYTFSDGVGKISPKLIRKITVELDLPSYPSAFQFRMGGYKGVVALSPDLNGEVLELRPSQKKFDSQHSTFEVIRIANYVPVHLNRQIILLLSALGIKDEVFFKLQQEMLEELNRMRFDPNSAITFLSKYSDEHGFCNSLAELIKAGFFDTKDRYVKNMLELIYTYILTDLKSKARIHIDKGALLIGVIDETGRLEEDEIFVQFTDPERPTTLKIIEDTCIITRNPCFHPGDIRVVRAVNVPELHHMVNTVVFSSRGERDIPSQCSGGDLDGDEFSVIWEPRLIPLIRNVEPMKSLPIIPTKVEKVEISDVYEFFINYIINDNLGIIANSHLAKSDKEDLGANHPDCIKLAQLHSRAVDFPKTGIPAELNNNLKCYEYPDFMQKHDKPMYESQKVLGKLYRSLEFMVFQQNDDNNADRRLKVEGYKDYVSRALALKCEYDGIIESIMSQYGIASELEVVSGFILRHREMVRKSSFQVRKAVCNIMENVRKDFKSRFEKEFLTENHILIDNASLLSHKKASAWYYTSYDTHAKEFLASSFSTFAWIVSDVLIEIFKSQKYEERNSNNNISFGFTELKETSLITPKEFNLKKNLDLLDKNTSCIIEPNQISALFK